MSTYYNFYTEGRINGEWHCIDPVGIRVTPHDNQIAQKLYQTYWNGSRSYFGDAYNKLMEYAWHIRFSDASQEFQKSILDSILGSYSVKSDPESYDMTKNEAVEYFDNNLLAISLSSLSSIVPQQGEHELHGVYHKNVIAAFKRGDIEDLYDAEMSPAEYAALEGDMRKVYEYFEWDDPMSWRIGITRLYAKVRSRLDDFASENFFEPDDVRIIMYTS